MSLEMVPPEPRNHHQRSSPLAQRRVRSYDDTVGEPDYDRNRITQFIRQPFSTKPTADELRRTSSPSAATSSVSARSRPTFSYNDTGSFEEVDEEKVGAPHTVDPGPLCHQSFTGGRSFWRLAKFWTLVPNKKWINFGTTLSKFTHVAIQQCLEQVHFEKGGSKPPLLLSPSIFLISLPLSVRKWPG